MVDLASRPARIDRTVFDHLLEHAVALVVLLDEGSMALEVVLGTHYLGSVPLAIFST